MDEITLKDIKNNISRLDGKLEITDECVNNNAVMLEMLVDYILKLEERIDILEGHVEYLRYMHRKR